MKIDATKDFEKDVKKLPRDLRIKIADCMKGILLLEEFKKEEISGIKIMVSSPAYYRIRIKDYRVGIKYQKETETVIFLTVKHRREIYSRFPPQN